MQDTTSEGDAARTGQRPLGKFLFEHRRWIHPSFMAVAVLVGGATRTGMLVGGALLLVYLAIRFWGCRHMGGAAHVHTRKAQERRVLITDGPFAWVRNPLYLGNTIGLAGACLLLGPAWLAGAAALASLLWYAVIVRWEEQVLTRLYPESYPAYVAAVPRFVPRIPPRAARAPPDGREPYPWLKVLRRERGAIATALVILILAALRQSILD
jgi:protein-S-isoprenylcysteine O-methyltransferase Ste14